jgi:SAM-dependent methyltransferase
MLERARRKGLRTLCADAQDLPLPDASFDAAAMVSMLHHTADPRRALAEAKRVLAPGGALAVKMYTREDVEHAWPLEYWPSSREWMLATHPPLAEFERELPGMRQLCLVFDDLEDASLAALTAHPKLVLEERWRRQISYFERLEREDPEGLAAGLRRLERDLEDGRWPGEAGRTTVITWRKPKD